MNFSVRQSKLWTYSALFSGHKDMFSVTATRPVHERLQNITERKEMGDGHLVMAIFQVTSLMKLVPLFFSFQCLQEDS